MVGNVRQWTASLWGERLQAPDEAYRYPWRADAAPAEASDIVRRVWRGGSYADPQAQLRCAFRGALFPTRAGAPHLRMGLRVVAEA
jgi:formylglycine-generating enzyme required for sulfatase activity